MRLYLVRHGETVWNRSGKIQTHSNGPETYLTDRGIAEARKNGLLFCEEPIQLVYHSTLVRTQQTAEEIVKLLSTSPVIVEDKRINDGSLGFLDGLTIQEFKDRFPEIYEAREKDKFHYRVPNLFPEKGYPTTESMEDVSNRTAPFIDELLVNDKNVVVVGHRGVNRVILYNLLKGHDYQISQEGIGNVQVPTSSVYRVTMKGQLIAVEHNLGQGWVQGLF